MHLEDRQLSGAKALTAVATDIQNMCKTKQLGCLEKSCCAGLDSLLDCTAAAPVLTNPDTS